MATKIEHLFEELKRLDEGEVEDLLAMDLILRHGLDMLGPSAIRDWFNLDDAPYRAAEHIKHPLRSFF